MAFSLLYRLGVCSLLKEKVDLVRYGIATAEYTDSKTISIRIKDRNFLSPDLLEFSKLNRIRADYPSNSKDLSEKFRVTDIKEKMKALVFPWKTSQGTMVGYTTEPEIDNHFLSLVLEGTLNWQEEAGIHPDIDIKGCSGAHIIAITGLIVSLHLKHINFVMSGLSSIPDVNYPMSLSIWRLKSELIEMISDFTDLPSDIVSNTINLLTVKSDQISFLDNEYTPIIPLFIEIGNFHFLSPVSSIFSNPFHRIRLLEEKSSEASKAIINNPREEWMRNELNHLFLGTRYRYIPKPVELKKNGQLISDIDAAVYDVTTGELALFQLKWQDFSTNNIRQQRSKAKNFTQQTNSWAEKINDWVQEFGAKALLNALQMKNTSPDLTTIHLFAIGRISARFQSYSYSTKEQIAAATWPQFIRLRHEIGPAQSVISALHKEILNESKKSIEGKPMPYTVIQDGKTIIFEDMWNAYS